MNARQIKVKYLGCLIQEGDIDEENPRHVDHRGPFTYVPPFSQPLTVQKCVEGCFYKRYKVAAMQVRFCLFVSLLNV